MAPIKRLLVAEWDGNAVYAGFITGVVEDVDKKTVTVTHKDIWWIWARRHILASRTNGAAAAPPITWNARTLATLANLIVAKGMDGDPADRYEMPVIMSADVVGTESRTYYGYKFVKVDKGLDDLIKTDGGPNIDFDTQWVGNEYFRWVMRSGALTQGMWEWDATAEKKEVYGLTFSTDAEGVTDKVFGAGEGSEASVLLRDADSYTGSAAPALERAESYSGISNLGELQSRVNADLNLHNDPTQQMSFRIPAYGVVRVSQLILGGTARVKTDGIRFLAAGWHDWQLIGYTFDREWITLQLQQTGG
ncbi:hypothetical protein [Paenarthrobacter sp. A20]|uniref:hypothetical protein n=1 Tax=Paenarthrobacter sp. A20 TaxID=2817891 RepID=UPI00209E5DCA|nr:hypothetical protein [Paenarthrobacter sp. A20]MCP1414411.1 hypothetical protein [Paenarthrobacter sp. A20]